MVSVTRERWEAAALRMFEDEYAFVAVGPRGHDDWAIDAVGVMERRLHDPRGWVTLDKDTSARADATRPRAYPFVNPGVEKIRERTFPITLSSAGRQLVAMVDDWFEAFRIDGFPVRAERLREDAAILLARFGDDARCYSTSPKAQLGPRTDPVAEPSAGYPFTDFTMDLGLIAASASEVGVFWRFNPI
ncbi:hypothetical protein [Streptomyces sp. JJ36]|uniref:hypothetical protein n=1 Tax=Streptomyces sp. JJ36 TaxID=2736645 RepID=UPI001F427063|nr:hypothetical protein [Streptomyces sp. JJ36]MCF6523826.1 hypothetical protein [Streptomyces sp. JJ36]